MVIRKEPTKEALEKLYDTCNKIFKKEKYFYSKEEVMQMKKDKNNIFLS